MRIAARTLLALAAILFSAGCRQTAPTRPPPAEPPRIGDILVPSPRLLVGRVAAVDAARGFAFVELAPEAPAPAVADGAELITRTATLQETGRLRASRFLRGRTLGTTILAGKPGADDEVVWLAP